MGKLGYGYGSEFHLLRFLGRHRKYLDSKILTALGNKNKKIDWLDFKFDSTKFIPDREYIGIEFLERLPNYQQLKKSWLRYWPSARNAQNWDAIGKIDDEWLLVEAKAHKGEIISDSTASKGSKKMINDRFKQIQNKYNITSKGDWDKVYYQKANRILFLEFLIQNNIKAKLLFIYFLNGYKKAGQQLGVTKSSNWQEMINKQDDYLGIVNCLSIKDSICNLIIDVYE